MHNAKCKMKATAAEMGGTASPVCHSERSEESASPVPQSLPPGGKVPPQGANEGVPRQGTATDEALRATDSTSSVSGLAGDARCHLPLQGKAKDGERIPSIPLKGKADEVAHTAALEITIHEGRNRQIRRMAEAAGLKPTRLKRIAEGGLRLGDLKPGQWRVLTAAECEALRREGEKQK